jgi:hypothetical protein
MTRLTMLAVLLALLVAGCSDTPAETGTATGTATEGAAARSTPTTFPECMRKHGAKDFPDQNGMDDQEFVEAIERANPESAAFKEALRACKDLQPPGLLGGKSSPKEMDQRLVFAQCMRENGVKDFPDPINGEPLVDTNRIPSSNAEGGMTILNAAMRTCGDIAEEILGER